MRILLKPKRKQLRQKTCFAGSLRNQIPAQNAKSSIFSKTTVLPSDVALTINYLSAPTGLLLTISQRKTHSMTHGAIVTNWQKTSKHGNRNRSLRMKIRGLPASKNLKPPVLMYPPAMHQHCSAPYLACACLND